MFLDLLLEKSKFSGSTMDESFSKIYEQGVGFPVMRSVVILTG
jgi:hypothetical protein